MKKFLKGLCLSMAVLLSSASLFACGGTQVGPNIDSEKTQIYVYAVNNGVGYKWTEYMAEEFNKLPGNENYQVVPLTGTSDLLVTIDSQVAAKTTNVNIYFGSQSAITNMITNDRLIDIEDVYEMKVDGNDTKIKDKTIDFDMYKAAFCDLNGNGIYAVPYTYGVNGLLFDYKFFLDNDYLIYAATSEKSAVEAQQGATCEVQVVKDVERLVATSAFGNYKVGDVILSAGKDGKYGTYDDGQAKTMAEFKTVLASIMDNNHFPLLYSTQYVEAYTQSSYLGTFVQSIGYENFKNFVQFKGDIKGADGQVQATLTTANGYTAWDTEAVNNAYLDAVNFYYEIVMGNVGNIGGSDYTADRMIHPSSFHTTSLSHTGAQDKFVTGFRTDDKAAFMHEGVWWERTEAVNTLNGLEKYGTTSDPRGFGKREYRYYLVPQMENQITPADQSIFTCQDDGCGVLLNNIPETLKTKEEQDAFVAKCKEFLAFTLSNDNLEYYTATHGIPRPFKYELSEESYNSLTPFEKNVWNMISDTEHITVYSPNVLNNTTIIRSYAKLSNWETSKIQKGATNAEYKRPYDAFKSVTTPLTVSEYINGIKTKISENYISVYYDMVKEYIND